VAGARFLLTVVIRTDAPSAADLQDEVGDAAVAGLRAADRAVSLLLSHLSTQGLDPSTIVAVVGTVEDQAPPFMRQVRLQVPLLIAGPGLSAGRSVDTVVETRALGPTLGRLAGLQADVDLLVSPAGHARFRDATGTRGVRQGNWTLWVGGDGQEQLFQVESDPEERSDLAPDRPDRVGALSALLDE
jgi:arylsulfatase A-like enzyme